MLCKSRSFPEFIRQTEPGGLELSATSRCPTRDLTHLRRRRIPSETLHTRPTRNPGGRAGRSGSPLGLPHGPSRQPAAQGFSTAEHLARPETLTQAARGQPEHTTSPTYGRRAGSSHRPARSSKAPGRVHRSDSPSGARPRSPGPHSTEQTSRRPTSTGALPARCATQALLARSPHERRSPHPLTPPSQAASAESWAPRPG